MRRGELFWGPLLVILGVLFFLKATGTITGDVFGWFWPILIIAAGAWILMGGLCNRGRYETAEKF
ncbi:MAG: LiaF transmembrane domain-containing protein [Anaerolineae bacterium]